MCASQLAEDFAAAAWKSLEQAGRGFLGLKCCIKPRKESHSKPPKGDVANHREPLEEEQGGMAWGQDSSEQALG